MTFRTPSTAFSSNGLPALFRPVPLMGFTLQSFAPPRTAVRLSASLLSCCFQQPQSSTLRFSEDHGSPQLQSLAPSVESVPGRTVALHKVVALLGFILSRVLTAATWPALLPASLPALGLDRPPKRSFSPVPRGVAVRCGQVNCCQSTDPPEVLHLNSPQVPPKGTQALTIRHSPDSARGVAPQDRRIRRPRRPTRCLNVKEAL